MLVIAVPTVNVLEDAAGVTVILVTVTVTVDVVLQVPTVAVTV